MSLSEISNPGRKIQIKAGQIEAMADLNDTKAAQAIWEALPLLVRVIKGDKRAELGDAALIQPLYIIPVGRKQ